MRQLYIPEIGDSIRLTADWTFGLYNEDRNSTLMEVTNDPRPVTYSWNTTDYSAIPCTIPAGSILKVDRIYIRKGKGEYSSLTFLWKDMRTKPKFLDKVATSYSGRDLFGDSRSYQAKKPARPVRFWAKLDDVNKIEFETV